MSTTSEGWSRTALLAGAALGAVALCAVLAQGAWAASKPPGYVAQYAPFPALPSPFTTQASEPCPAGTVTWGGGVRIYSGSLPSTIGSSFWNGATPGAWVGTVGTSSTNVNFLIVTTCANKPSGYKLITKTIDDPAGAMASGTVTCPTGSVLLSGGLATTADTANVYQLTATPTSNRAFHGVQMNLNSLDQPLHLNALCAAKPPAYTRVTRTVSIPVGMDFPVDATCPSGTVVIGGGYAETPLSAQVDVYAESRLPTYPRIWEAIAFNESTSAVTLTGTAICAA
jgi:hypothetical protein